MANCLVTTLKASVNNPDLPKFGRIQIFVPKGLESSMANIDSYSMQSGEDVRFSAKVLDEHSYFYVAGQSGTHLATIDVSNSYIYFKIDGNYDGNFELDVYNSSFAVGVMDLDKFVPSEKMITIRPLQGNKADNTFSQSTGSINKLGSLFPNLLCFSTSYLYGITGDIETGFGKCTKMRLIDVRDCGVLTGSLDGLASAMVSNGRTTGTLTVRTNGNFTLNGTVIGNNVYKYVKFGSSLPSGAEYTGTGFAVYATNPDA